MAGITFGVAIGLLSGFVTLGVAGVDVINNMLSGIEKSKMTSYEYYHLVDTEYD